MIHRTARSVVAVVLSVSVVTSQSMAGWNVGIMGGAKRVMNKRPSPAEPPAPANMPPTVSKIADRIIATNGTATAVFQVNDAETPAESLSVEVTSDNPELVTNDRLSLTGSGVERTLVAEPVLDKEGTATVTVSVADAEGLKTTTQFTLSAERELPYVPGEILVTYREGAVPRLHSQPRSGGRGVISLGAMRPLLRKRGSGNSGSSAPGVKGASRVSSLRIPAGGEELAAKSLAALERTYVVTFDPREDVQNMEETFQRESDVEEAGKNQIFSIDSVDDPYFTGGDLWGLQKVHASEAWAESRGEGVVVAVLDTGIDMTHPDLADNLWINPGEIPGNGIDDEGNGFIDDVNGWNFVDNTHNLGDGNGHGTHVSGTISAVGENGEGVIGLAYKAKIMAVKGLSDQGRGTLVDLANGLRYAVDNGADVINNSWGGAYSCGDNVIAHTVNYAYGKGLTIVGAAGNENMDVAGFTPGGCANVISVAATDSADEKAAFSNWGGRLDVAAPGVNILSTIPGNKYMKYDGTSMACPHVTGLVAMILSKYPTFTNEHIRQVVRSSSDDIGDPGFDEKFGYGRINAQRALSVNSPLRARILSPNTGSVVITDTSQIIPIEGMASGSGFGSYSLEYRKGSISSSWTPFIESNTPVSNGVLGQFDPLHLNDGMYTIRLRVQNRDGVNFFDQITLEIRTTFFTDPDPTLAKNLRPGATIILSGTMPSKDFQHYRLEWANGLAPSGLEWGSVGLTLSSGGNMPVSNSQLGTFTLPASSEASYYTIRLVADYKNFQREARTVVYLDPDLMPGWPQLFGNENPRFSQGTWGGPISMRTSTGNLVVGISKGAGPKNGFLVFSPNGEILANESSANTTRKPAIANMDGSVGDEALIAGKEFPLMVMNHQGQMVKSLYLPDDTFDGPDYFEHNGAFLDDLNGDGNPELITTTLGLQQFWKHFVAFEWNGVIVSPMFAIPMGRGNLDQFDIDRKTFAAVDLNGDGNKEIVIAEQNFGDVSLRCYDNLGNPLSWGDPNISFRQVVDIAVSDLEHDGSPEIIVSVVSTEHYTTGDIYIISAEGAIIRSWESTTSDRLFGFQNLAIADLDQNGHEEIVAMSDSRLSVWRPNGNLVWAKAGEMLNGGAVLQLYGSNCVIGNVVGDSKPEIVIGHDTEAGTRLLAISFDSTVAKSWRLQSKSGGKFVMPLIADFDGNGTNDIAVTYAENGSGLGVGGPPVIQLLDTGIPVNPSEMYWPQIMRDSWNTSSTISHQSSDTQKPSVPSNLEFTVVSPSQLNLSWSPSTDNVGVVAYLLDLSRDIDFSSFVTGYHNKSIAGGASISLANLNSSTTYYARLRARDGAGNLSSGYSETVWATTGAVQPVAPSLTSVNPNPITIFGGVGGGQVTVVAQDLDSATLTLRVTNKDGCMTQDSVVMSKNGTTFTGQLDISGHTWMNGTIRTVEFSVGDEMFIPVTGNVQVNVQAAPDTTAPSAPTGASMSAVSSTQVNVTWTASTDNVGVTGYLLDLSTNAGFTSYVAGYQGLDIGNVTGKLISGLNGSTTYYARLKAKDASGNISGYSSTASATTNAAVTSPGIATHPANQTVTAGQTATFNVSATGTGPLTYQWQKNSVNISGATGSSYTTPATTTGDSGTVYRVIVTNSAGSVTSNGATLTVNAGLAPIIMSHPQSQTVTAGQTASFGVTVANVDSFQWQKNGVNVAGATGDIYTTPATTTGDSGTVYRVIVTNSAGSVTSNGATLTVNAAVLSPGIATHPANQTVTAGQTATFSVMAAGTGPLTYQWQKNSVNISGATGASYTTPATTTGDSGTVYRVIVANSAGSVTSNGATLTVNAAPVPTITSVSPANGTTGGGRDITIIGTGFVGTPTIKFGSVSGSVKSATSTQIVVTTPAQTMGAKDVRVINPDLNEVTKPAAFTYYEPLSISSVTPNEGPSAGGTTVTITGTGFWGNPDIYFANNNFVRTAVILSVSPDGRTMVVKTPGRTDDSVVAVHVNIIGGQFPFGNYISRDNSFTYSEPDTTAPSAPTGASMSAVSSTQVNVTWTASTDDVGVTSYLLDLSTNVGFTSYVAGYQGLDVGNVTAKSITGLNGSTTYYARLKAKDASGNMSGYSSTASATTSAAPDTTAPSAPTGASMSAVSWTQVNVTWTASTDNVGVTSYLLDLSTNVGFTSYVAGYQGLDVGNVTAKSITGLNGSTTYYARLKAKDASGNMSGYSSTANATTSAAPDTTAPSAPTGASMSAVSSTQVNVTWTASTDNVGVTSYLLDLSTNVGFTSYVAGYQGLDVGNVTAKSITGLNGSTTYYARLKAKDASGNMSGYSSTANATTSAAPVPTITSVSPANGTTGGGRDITIIGTGFVGTPTIKFGSVAGSVRSATSTQIVVTTPAQAMGAKDVRVINPDLKEVTKPAAFTYYEPLSISSVSPNEGPSAGGTTVTITGTGFWGNPIIYFANYNFVVTAVILSVSADGRTMVVKTPGKPEDSLVAVDISIPEGQFPDGSFVRRDNSFTYR